MLTMKDMMNCRDYLTQCGYELKMPIGLMASLYQSPSGFFHQCNTLEDYAGLACLALDPDEPQADQTEQGVPEPAEEPQITPEPAQEEDEQDVTAKREAIAG